MKIFRKYRKFFVATVTAAFLTEILAPLSAFAITGHDSMPEYRSFEPVSTTNMVNVFNGGFTYNIPLLDVPNGYPINLSYHSDEINNEALASWVGLGWNINPGAVNRAKRGFPDEFKGESVTYHNRMPASTTIAATVGGGMELFGGENGALSLGGLNLAATLRYNNYKGLGTSVSAGLTAPMGIANLDFSLSAGKRSITGRINYGSIITGALQRAFKSTKETSAHEQEVNEKVKQAMTDVDPDLSEKMKGYLANKVKRTLTANDPSASHIGFSAGSYSFGAARGGVSYSISSIPETSYPAVISPYSGIGGRVKVEAGVNPFPIPMDVEGSVMGSFLVQTNEPTYTKQVYGYQFSEEAIDEEAVMDYFTEMDQPFEKREKYLGYPLPNNDFYSLTGEAIGGSFRPYRSEFGHYRKDKTESSTITVNAGADFNFASVITAPPLVSNLVYTVGGNLGGDYQELKIGGWDSERKGDAAPYEFHNKNSFPESAENFFYRFSGDKGGNFHQAAGEAAFKPQLNVSGFNATLAGFTPYKQKIDSREEKQRSTYIAYSRIEDYTEESNNIRYKVNEKKLRYLIPAATSGTYTAQAYEYTNNDYTADAIGEFTTYNTDGIRYVYGLPVFTRNEEQLQYSMEDGEYTTDGLIATVSADISTSAKRKVGYASPGAYPTTHLLTQITSPDYVDRTMDGPTKDDFGSYTRFNYVRVNGGADEWYPYRNPYTGASFNIGSLSDKHDDMGSYTFGEKEVYYLHSLASKTHVAIFTLEDREDGLSANVNALSSDDDLLKGAGSATTQTLKKLTRIDLYAIEDCEEYTDNNSDPSGIYRPRSGAVPIQTVRFQYDYSLCPNTDNSNAATRGKLTLKKVWFEYQGKIASKIAPYQFSYTYPATNYPAAYDHMENYGTGKTENPPYDMPNTDRWGNYRDYSSMEAEFGDIARFYPFVDQDPASTYDPAAWCLKQITLPSGGEIHVQYEQKDYQHVQDKRAMVMVPLATTTNQTDDKYYLDLARLGISNTEITPALVRELFEPIKNERIYFNFLYAFLGSPDYTARNSEYIEGYARIAGYGYDGGGAFFSFKNTPGTYIFWEPVNYGAKFSKRELPRKVCIDYYNANRRGKISGRSNALSEAGPDADNEKLIRTLLGLASVVAPNPTLCTQMDPSMSYVRLQAVSPKLGGGVRVKRLLRYDGGMAAGDQVLYGQEYDYTTYDEKLGRHISSGVATNEPAVGRRENALVKPLDRSEQNTLEAIAYGRDMYSQEGSLGESLLPSASIGYSQVRIKNIHTGETAPGYEVHEFYTCRDFPFRSENTVIDQALKASVGGNVGISTGDDGVNIGVGYTRQTPYMTQGYSFITNEMHGQPKRVAKYGAARTGKLPVVTAEEVYEYFEPGSQVSVMDESYSTTQSTLGVESEILSELRQVEEFVTGGNVEGDLSGGGVVLPVPPFAVPLVFVTLKEFGIFTSENILRTHVTSKIINYPAILKKVVRNADGVRHITENLVFDKHSGEPVVVKSYDDFSGTYLSQDFLASWNYDNFRSKATNEKIVSKAGANGLSITYGSSLADGEYLQFEGGSACGEAAKYTRGDLIEIDASCTGGAALYHIDETDPASDRVYLQPSGMKNCNLSASSTISSVTVIQSGYNNRLKTKMGYLMAHNETGANDYYEGVDPLNAVSNAFVTDLNAALDANFSISGGEIILPGARYNDICMMLDECILDANNAQDLYLYNVIFGYHIDATTKKLKLWLKSFDVVNFNSPTGQQTIVVNCSTQQDDEGPYESQPFMINVTENENFAAMPAGGGGCNDVCNEQNVHEVVLESAIMWASNNRTMKVCLGGERGKVEVKPQPFMSYSPTRIYQWRVKKIESPTGSTYDWKASGRSLLNYTYNLTGNGLLTDIEHGAKYQVNCRKYSWFGTNLVEDDNMYIIVNAAPPTWMELNTYGSEICITETDPTPTQAFNGDYLSKGSPNATKQWYIGNANEFSNPPVISSPTRSSTNITFYDPGVYEIVFEVTSELGACADIIRYFTVKDCNPCYANITADAEACLPNTNSGWTYGTVNKTFTRQVETDENCSSASCNWEIIRNSTGNTIYSETGCSQIDYDFDQPGFYTVELNTSTTDGGDQTGQHVIEIKDCRPPRATFSVTDPACPDREVVVSVDQSSQVENFSWDMGDGNVFGGANLTEFSHTYEDCGPHTITLTVTNTTGVPDQSYTVTQTYAGNEAFPCHPVCACYSEFPVEGLWNGSFNGSNFTTVVGKFYVDARTGSIVFKQADCPRTYPFDCIQFCGALMPAPTLPNVVTASATIFSDDWDYTESIYFPDNTFNGNEYEKAILGKWRPQSQFTYRADLDQNSEQYNYERGKFSLEVFDWEEPENNNFDNWQLTSTTTKYSPNGEPLEDVNIMGIYSAAKYGYNHTLPVLVAQNAQHSSVAYESFENLYQSDSYFEDGLEYDNTKGTRTNTYSHTGSYSVEMEAGEIFEVGSVAANGEQYLVRAWFKPAKDMLENKLEVKSGTSAYKMYSVASAGEWILFETLIPSLDGTGSIGIYLADDYYGKVYLDDVRIQPYESEMVCYVYDKNQRLQAVLDDQHFAMIYEYNSQGELVRKLKETAEGIKTISETQYNIKGVDRQ